MSPTLQSHFADYASHHRTAGNQLCHSFGIPIIVFSLVGMLQHVGLASASGYTITLAHVAIAAATIYYLRLDPPLAAGMLAYSALSVWLGGALPWTVCLGLFVFGWILQFVGHSVYEKRSPAFLKNFVHLLVGPLWILAKATRRT
ncbi:MAG TPA: Mpo1-like protein [Vicinamibacteria bacterium]|nr:Mpo1-like protein [Vicinamibacteria bacterium]